MRRVGAWALGRVVTEGRGAVRLTALAVVLLTAIHAPTRLRAQASIHAQAIPLVTSAAHMPEGGRTLTEFAIVQPTIMLEWRSPRSGDRRRAFLARATFNAEGLTIEDGELAPGDFGEGFFDRRHPHTYVHELIMAGHDLLGRHDGGLRLSVAGGPKGFVAFGTDDPMSRPVVRYPVNHHFAQILERAVVIGSVAYGPATLEVTWFNGDEPTQPTDWPNWVEGDEFRAALLDGEGILRRTASPTAAADQSNLYLIASLRVHMREPDTGERRNSNGRFVGGIEEFTTRSHLGRVVVHKSILKCHPFGVKRNFRCAFA